MRKRLVHTAIVTVFCLLAISAAAGQQPRAKMLEQTDWLAAHTNDPNVVIIHVGRDRTGYDAGHIPNARFLALSDIAVTKNGVPNELPEPDKLQSTFEALGVDNTKRIVLYGDHNGLYASRAYFTLDYLGAADNAALLDGGLEKWKAESRAISNEQPKVIPGKLAIKVHPELVADLSQVQNLLNSKKGRFVDARPADEYSGAKPSDGVPRAGHIPGAVSVFWMDNLQTDANGVLKPQNAIRANYDHAGLKPGDQPVVYCRTGVQASHDYFTLKMLGFDPILYDGSFFEWSNAKNTPVETTAPQTKH